MNKKVKLYFFTNSSISQHEEELSELLSEGWQIEAFTGRPSERKRHSADEQPVFYGSVILSREDNQA
jgi:hypothetical protein